MKLHLHTRLYHLNVHDFDHEVAHLYEHLLIESFTKQLRDNKLPVFLSGWVSGQTFNEIMFIEAGFYNQSAAEFFDNYMTRGGRIDWSLVDTMLNCIQSEARAKAVSIDNELLQSQLKTLDAAAFALIDTDTADPCYYPIDRHSKSSASVITLKPSKKNFRDITILFGATELTTDEKLAFLRMTPFIRHFIDTMMVTVGAHKQEWGHTVDRPQDGLMDLDIYTIHRSRVSAGEIEKLLAEHLYELISEVTAYPEALQQYADIFVNESRWEDFPIQYFKWSGIVASRTSIAAALTQENVASVLEKLQFSVVPASEEHWRYT